MVRSVVAAYEDPVRPSSRSDLGVLWDMDGVIVDTARFHWQAWQKLSGAEGLPMDYADFQHTFGWRNEELLKRLLGQDVPYQRVAQLAETKEALYRDAVRGRVVALPGAVELLLGFRKLGYRQAVCSSAPRANIDLILSELCIEEHFGAVLSEHDVDRGKPDPQVFARAAQILDVVPSRCLVIEDSVMGVRAAKCAGMACLAVTTTHPAKGLSEAEWVVTSLSEVTAGHLSRLIEARTEQCRSRYTSGG